ncbi:Dihydroflavonol-4-reductase, putative [Theobroma cacao]|uniref:Flavanone 4-reductase n=1 Tax=Theobroma cacao TaxID=3641 RepID=A0A061DFN9_THECC|nr:Dihydroflavonol-4-reductase, putative [Theobroma cacao]
MGNSYSLWRRGPKRSFYQESMGSTEKRVYICLFFYVAMSITNAFTRVHHHNGITTYAPLHRTSAQNHLLIESQDPEVVHKQLNFVAPTSSLMLSSVLFFGQNEVIKPTVDGALSILKSCANAKTVERLVFVSSGGTVAMQERKLVQYDETSWSDVDFIRAKKMTGWMYFASKTLAEKAAWGAAQENDIDFISVIPTLVVGPFIIPSMPPSLITALSLITRNEGHYSIIKQCQYVHLDDLCNALVFLYENPEAHGRYICSSHDATIFDLAEMLRQKYPGYDIPIQYTINFVFNL